MSEKDVNILGMSIAFIHQSTKSLTIHNICKEGSRFVVEKGVETENGKSAETAYYINDIYVLEEMLKFIIYINFHSEVQLKIFCFKDNIINSTIYEQKINRENKTANQFIDITYKSISTYINIFNNMSLK
jgi:hypothetical protein